ncbi:MAG: TIM barrel protein [Crenarchaeota archaeon]|nr:TIM barrel protein [Thermoproteota archaeon]
MKFGINVWSFPKGVSTEDAINAAKTLGYDGFEPALTLEQLQLSDTDFDALWRSIRKASSDVGIDVPSVATGLFWRVNPLRDAEGALKIVRKLCRAAEIVEARTILVVPGTGLSEMKFDECLSRLVDFLKRASSIARGSSVTVGVENVWNRILGSPLEMKVVIERVSADNVKVYLDVGNTLPHSLPEHWIDVLGADLIAQIHVKDFSIAELRFGIPLTGDVNWSAVSRRLRELGYSGYVVAEVPPYRGHPYRAAEDTLRSLREIFGGSR